MEEESDYFVQQSQKPEMHFCWLRVQTVPRNIKQEYTIQDARRKQKGLQLMTDSDKANERTAENFFIDVQHRAPEIEAPLEAEDLTHEVLGALAGMIDSEQMTRLSNGLPHGVVPARSSGENDAQIVDKQTFVELLTSRSDSAEPEVAVKRAQAVLSTVRQWTDSRFIDEIVQQLPGDLPEVLSAP